MFIAYLTKTLLCVSALSQFIVLRGSTKPLNFLNSFSDPLETQPTTLTSLLAITIVLLFTGLK